MKSKKFGKCFVVLALVLVLVAGVTGVCTSQASAQPETLKIGCIAFFGFPLGLDFARGVELLAEVVNNKGGLDIGGKKYNIKAIVYDSKFSDEVSRAAAERLVYKDKVKFILGDPTVDAWLSATETNKVITIGCGDTPVMFDPKNKYTFSGHVAHTEAPQLWGWFAGNYPNVKTCFSAHPDNRFGQTYGALTKKLAESFSLKMLDQIFYPPDATDFSAVGTKVKNLNADVFVAQYGGPVADNLCYKAAWQAGWKGQAFASSTVPAATMMQVVPPEAVEGMILGAWTMEMDTPPPVAREFMDAWIAKYGKWESPEIIYTNAWYVLMAALKQANSLDPDKVANVLANGMKYKSPCFVTSGVMVSRPDLGNSRTVDTLGDLAVKRIEGGKAKIIGTVSIEEAIKANKTFFGW